MSTPPNQSLKVGRVRVIPPTLCSLLRVFSSDPWGVASAGAGPFRVFNCANEAACLRCWFDHMRTVQPAVYVTYNGDYFDWPFIETRAGKYGMDMEKEIGFKCQKSGECLSRCAVHMDCLHWVNRDSYLPQGSRGLKMVTKAKLGYDPVELDPELMMTYAREKP